MHFIVQSNINQNDFDSLKLAVERAGHTFESFYHKPFDTYYPKFDIKKPTFIYAASSVTDQIFDDNKYKFVGVYNHTSALNMHNYYKGAAASLMWSPRAYKGTINEAIRDIKPSLDLIFARPAIDDKLFAGQACTQIELVNMLKNMVSAVTEIGNSEIFLGGYKQPHYEYRLFCVRGKAFASSLYRVNGVVTCQEGSPDNVQQLAYDFYNANYAYIPALSVIDIATDEYGENPGVIEVNSIHNSGFYDINKSDFVNGISKEMSEHYANIT